MASLDFETENREFREWYGNNYPVLRTAEKTCRNLIHLLLSGMDGLETTKVLSRLKDRDECVKKFQRKYQAKLEEEKTLYSIREHITDLIGIRVICLYESDIHKVVAGLSSNFQVLNVTDKTSELEEKEDRFGYKGMHLDIGLSQDRGGFPEYEKLMGFQFEVQIRTIVQDAWSEIDHKLKYKKDLPKDLKRRVYNLAGLFELADREFDSIKNETNKLIEDSLKAEARAESANDPLSPFNFYKLMTSQFPNYRMDENKIEGFVDEIREVKPDITIGEIFDAVDNHFERVEKYRQWSLQNLGRNMNPYTEMRHVLVRSNTGTFQSLLFDRARDNFYKWDVDGSVFKSSANN